MTVTVANAITAKLILMLVLLLLQPSLLIIAGTINICITTAVNYHYLHLLLQSLQNYQSN